MAYSKVNVNDPELYEFEERKSLTEEGPEEDDSKNEENGDVHKNGTHKELSEKPDLSSTEKQEEKIPYPKSVFFIVSNEFCERFSYYGMRTILSIYLVNILLFSESDSIIIFHTFNMLTYFFPLLGAILSDSWLGKFRTIFYVSMLYAVGNILLALAAAKPVGIPQMPFSLVALLFIALGTGGIKPCVSAFGGDQFILPQQEKQLAMFFSFFYFAINSGSLISTFLTPVLRDDVHCFGEDSCFSLAFAIPGILMVVAIIIFGLGRPMYKVRKPTGNVVVRVTKCISHAIWRKIKSDEKQEHWLDYSEEKYGKQLVEDVKVTLRVLLLYVPLPIFWAVYDQQGSAWTFQAVRMDGDLGFYTILPDQMQVVNPILILLFIPLFNYWIYPLCSKCNFIKSPLQRIVFGGILAALSFVISGGVSLALEQTLPVLPSSGNSQLRIYNTLTCDAKISSSAFGDTALDFNAMGYLKTTVKMHGSKSYDYTIEGCDGVWPAEARTGTFDLKEEKGYGYSFYKEGVAHYEDDIDKDDDGLPRIRTLVDTAEGESKIIYLDKGEAELKVPVHNHTLFKIDPGTYKIKGTTKHFEFKLGAVYSVMVQTDADQKPVDVKVIEVTKPNSVHIFWQLPQYIVITGAEIMVSITGLEFSYSQAPVSMKSVLQAAWLLTTAFGNLIIIIIESAKIFDEQSSVFFLYAGLMAADMIIFALMSRNYKYVEKPQTSEAEELEGYPNKEKEVNALDNPAFKNNNDET